MQILNATGLCPKCGNGFIDVNGEKKCLRCQANRNINESSPTDIKDPGEAELSRVLKDISVVTATGSIKHGTVQDVLNIMKNLPMPNDVKQFKQIKKIISLIEDLQPKG